MKKIIRITAVFMLVFMLVSCAMFSGENKGPLFGKNKKNTEDTRPVYEAETLEKTVSEPVLQDFQSLGFVTAAGNKSAVQIAEYQIRGQSEEGDFFPWMVAKDTNLVLSGITQGHWTFEIRGLDNKGNIVLQGVCKTTFTEKDDVFDVVYETIEGLGDVKVNYYWTKANKIINPQIDIYLKAIGESEYHQVSSDEITYEGNTATWHSGALQSGKYYIKAILKDSGYIIGGAGSALKVFPSLTSTGDVEIITNSYTMALDMSSLIPFVNDVDGAIVLDGNRVYCNSPVANATTVYHWFVDGVEIDSKASQVDNISSYCGEGNNHRIDCILDNGDAFSNFQIVVMRTAEGLEEITSITGFSSTEEKAPANAEI